MIGTKTWRRPRVYGRGSLVTVSKKSPTGNPIFLRYETPDGVPCDERGIPLGTVKFKARVIR